jgi:hypothetical protein
VRWPHQILRKQEQAIEAILKNSYRAVDGVIGGIRDLIKKG